MAIVHAEPGLSSKLASRIAAHRAELTRLHAEGADPLAELHAFIRDTFTAASLIEAYEEYRRGYPTPADADEVPDAR